MEASKAIGNGIRKNRTRKLQIIGEGFNLPKSEAPNLLRRTTHQ
jgi:hypothetical protein